MNKTDQLLEAVVLPRPSGDGGRFAVVPAPVAEQAFLAVDRRGYRVVLAKAEGLAAGVRLSAITASHGVTATIHIDGRKPETAAFSMIVCEAQEEELQSLFVSCLCNALPAAAGRTARSSQGRRTGRCDASGG